MRELTIKETTIIDGGLRSVFWSLAASAAYDGIKYYIDTFKLPSGHSHGYYGPGGNWLPR